MLPTRIEERSLVVQVIERAEERHDVRGMKFGEAYGWRSQECVVLEYDCRATFVLHGRVAARHAGLGILECGVCGERFALTRVAGRGHTMIGRREARNLQEESRYSWFDDCLERLKGKEARHEYYVRFEGRAALR